MLEDITLGKRYRDRVTGFEGIATARTEYLHACERVCLTGDAKEDGTIHEWWVDSPAVERVDGREYEVPRAAVEGIGRTGGDRPAPPARSTGKR